MTHTLSSLNGKACKQKPLAASKLSRQGLLAEGGACERWVLLFRLSWVNRGSELIDVGFRSAAVLIVALQITLAAALPVSAQDPAP